MRTTKNITPELLTAVLLALFAWGATYVFGFQQDELIAKAPDIAKLPADKRDWFLVAMILMSLYFTWQALKEWKRLGK